MMMKRLADQNRAQLDEMKAIRKGNEGGAGEGADGTETTKKVPKKSTKGKPAAKSTKSDANDDEDNVNIDTVQGDDDGAANKGKTKSRAPRTKAASTEDDGSQSPPKRGAKKA